MSPRRCLTEVAPAPATRCWVVSSDGKRRIVVPPGGGCKHATVMVTRTGDQFYPPRTGESSEQPADQVWCFDQLPKHVRVDPMPYRKLLGHHNARNGPGTAVTFGRISCLTTGCRRRSLPRSRPDSASAPVLRYLWRPDPAAAAPQSMVRPGSIFPTLCMAVSARIFGCQAQPRSDGVTGYEQYSNTSAGD